MLLPPPIENARRAMLRGGRIACFQNHDKFLFPCEAGRCLGFFMVSEMRFFASSTSLTQTVTTSPTESTSDGWRIKRSQICEICTSPS